MTLTEKMINKLREYHALRVLMIGMRSADDKKELRQQFNQAERELNELRRQAAALKKRDVSDDNTGQAGQATDYGIALGQSSWPGGMRLFPDASDDHLYQEGEDRPQDKGVPLWQEQGEEAE